MEVKIIRCPAGEEILVTPSRLSSVILSTIPEGAVAEEVVFTGKRVVGYEILGEVALIPKLEQHVKCGRCISLHPDGCKVVFEDSTLPPDHDSPSPQQSLSNQSNALIHLPDVSA